MDNKNLIDETVPKYDSDVIAQDDHSQVQQPIRRELDSLDDFEHLQMGQESPRENAEADLLGLHSESTPAGEVVGIINKGAETAAHAASKITDPLSSFDPPKFDSSKVDILDVKMDSNLLEMGDSFPDRREADAKLDKFLSDFPAEKIDVPSYEKQDDFRAVSQNFMDMERGSVQTKPDVLDQPLKPSPIPAPAGDLLDRYSDSEPEVDDFKPSNDFAKKEPTLASQPDFFKDIHEDDVQPELPKRDYPEKEPSPVREMPPAFVEPVKKEPEVVRKEPQKEKKVESVVVSKESKTPVIEAEVMFCKMGLGKLT